jgi:hypothetical protein
MNMKNKNLILQIVSVLPNIIVRVVREVDIASIYKYFVLDYIFVLCFKLYNLCLHSTYYYIWK